jgi:hypothetical protein
VQSIQTRIVADPSGAAQVVVAAPLSGFFLVVRRRESLPGELFARAPQQLGLFQQRLELAGCQSQEKLRAER